MPKTKSLKGSSVQKHAIAGMDSNKNIEFDYKGQHFEIPVVESMFLKDMSVVEIKDSLNELPARISYWRTFAIELDREIEEAREVFDLWFQQAYMDVDTEYPKKTEGWKKSRVMLENADEYRERKYGLRTLTEIAKKIDILVSGYNTKVWTLREVARLTHAEISSISGSVLKGGGSLADL